MVLVTVSLLGVNVYGFYHLKQDFDLVMYIPSNSYAHKFAKAQEQFFPNRGVDVNVYCGQFCLKENPLYLFTHKIYHNASLSILLEKKFQYFFLHYLKPQFVSIYLCIVLEKSYSISFFIFEGDIHYGSSQKILNNMLQRISSDPGVENGTVISWFPAFTAWLRSKGDPKLAKYSKSHI